MESNQNIQMKRAAAQQTQRPMNTNDEFWLANMDINELNRKRVQRAVEMAHIVAMPHIEKRF